ncbi:MAG: hypothetical protein ACOCXV_02405, partial [Bacteroidota bacterium]
DILDVTESFTFQHEFVIYSNQASFTDTALVNLGVDHPLIEEYGSKIKQIEVQSIKYWLIAHNGSDEQMLNTLTLRVANADGTDARDVVALENIALHQLLNNPTDLTIIPEGRSKLEDLVELPPHAFEYSIESSINEVPADFTLVFEVTAKMTANPLN